MSTLAGHHEGGDHAVAAEQMGDKAVWASGARAIVAEVEGEVIAVDMATREVVVRSPCWQLCHADCAEDVRPGDTVVVLFTEALVLSLKQV